MNDGPGTDTDGGAERSVPATLLGDDVETLERVLAGRSAGPIAVCSPPFGGRERVLEHAADQLDTELLCLGPGDGAGTLLSALGDGPVAVDGCQHLYERRIGGFEPLDSVLRAIAEREEVVVAGWNNYAWTYLARVRGVDRTFPARVETGPAASDDLAALILERYDAVPEFAHDQEDSDGLFDVRRREFGWRGHGLSVPVPVRNRAAGALDGGVDPQDVVFERLAAVSEGNLGVATAIWEVSRRAELRPSDIVAPGTDLDLEREEAFGLRILLQKERVERAELTRILEDAGRVLGRLRREGLVSAANGVVELEPTAVPAAVAEAERGELR